LSNNATVNPNGINYFGYWLSALDAGNMVTFFNGNTQVGALTAADVLAKTGPCPGTAYCGNPNQAFLGQDSGEPFVFINFYDTTGTFDKVVFSEDPSSGAGYESDNHTVGFYTQMGGVPEPSTWAMMGLGFASVAFLGFRSRRRLASIA
jgi:PEP-CTERM motif